MNSSFRFFSAGGAAKVPSTVIAVTNTVSDQLSADARRSDTVWLPFFSASEKRSHTRILYVMPSTMTARYSSVG